MTTFSQDIQQFNGIYKLPVNATPTLDIGVPATERLKAFKSNMMGEVEEIE